MPLEFKPESVEQARDRFTKAVEKVWTVTAAMLSRPGIERENVFDFFDGLRLIVSREKVAHGTDVMLHVSASMQPDTFVWKTFAKHNKPWKSKIPLFREYVQKRFAEISGGLRCPAFYGVSDGGVVHWSEVILEAVMDLHPQTYGSGKSDAL